MDVPGYIEERIRKPMPPNCGVLPYSTPVIAIGDLDRVRMSILGLNPSRIEFQDRRGRELTGSDRRFETTTSLGVDSLETAPSAAIERVYAAWVNYFDSNPYRRWFDQLDAVLQHVGTTYYDRSACHLDLVQWATDPAWGQLSAMQKRNLLKHDVPFLRRQLRRGRFDLLLLNGSGMIKTFRRFFDAGLDEVESVDFGEVGLYPTRFFTGRVDDTAVIGGLSTNLRSSYGITNHGRQQIASLVEELAPELL